MARCISIFSTVRRHPGTPKRPREKLFEFGRCIVHFAVDDAEVWICTELRGKSNSIAWLAHQLIAQRRLAIASDRSDKSDVSDLTDKTMFDSVIVVTDRRILDDQIQRTVKQFMQVGATVGHAERSGDFNDQHL